MKSVMKTAIAPIGFLILVAGAAGFTIVGCGAEAHRRTATAQERRVPPLELRAIPKAAYVAAADVALPETPGGKSEGLYNVFHLSKQIVSGSEPEGEAAFQTLADLGIKTILSVDGKAPEVERAARFGMRYVHLPLRYRGVTEQEFDRLSAMFLEAEPPFYVHCFHGKHRGPAAAAIGRIALDGADRRQALAEMRQWCGTAERYAGLYHSVATRPVPTDTKATIASWGMPSRVGLGGYREAMVAMVRDSDVLEMFAERAWEANPAHPDLDPVNAADKIASLLERSQSLDRVVGHKAMAKRNAVAAKNARRLADLLRERKRGGDVGVEAISEAFKAVQTDCKGCHTAYRNR